MMSVSLLVGRWLLAGAMVMVFVGCGGFTARELSGVEVPAPSDFSFVGETSPCYLELAGRDSGFRVNCFHIDGTLHIHSNRWAKLPRLEGENWTQTVLREPEVRVEIAGKIYPMRGGLIEDEQLRQQILNDRGYWYAWDGITVVRFTAR